MTSHIRHGRGAVRAYVYGPYELPEFLTDVLGAEVLERHDMGAKSAHVELQLGDSVLVVEAGDLPPDFTPTVASVYVYVEDVDAAYARSIEAGLQPVSEPEDKPYQERSAAIQDARGNVFYLSTYTG